MQDILLIGNGFDIYHGLPTRYTDFLVFVNNWNMFYSQYRDGGDSDIFQLPLDKDGKLIPDSMDEFARHGGYNDDLIQYLNSNISGNLWIDYFNKRMKDISDKWIDFEDEINNVLLAIEVFYSDILPHRQPSVPLIKQRGNQGIYYVIKHFCKNVRGFDINLINGVVGNKILEPDNIKDLKKQSIKCINDDLKVLTECLRIYLIEFVSRISVSVMSEQVKALNGCCVASFNYTYTYQTVYGFKEGGLNHQVHGELKENNLVLGVDGKAFTDDNEYADFIKYFQIIMNNTGSFYKEWIRDFNSLNDEEVHLYVFGHSLGIIDKDIIYEFLTSNRVKKITMFYHNDGARKDLLHKLLEILGQDLFKNYYDSRKIEFELLQKAVPRLSA